jgi:vacuolar-type H+-ATPase subunit F/Vma7
MSTEGKPGAAVSRIAVVGRHDVVVPFQAAGLEVFPVEPGPDASPRVQTLVYKGYHVIFFTEDMLPYLAALLEQHRRSATPCLVSLPLGGAQQAAARLKDVVKRAVGADIFGGEVPPGKGVR